MEQQNIDEDIKVDAAIKRFELAFELALKTMQDYLQAQGYVGIKGPGKVLGQSLQDGYIEDNELWSSMLEDRNILVHVYDYDKSRVVYQQIASRYLSKLEQFFKKYKDESAK